MAALMPDEREVILASNNIFLQVGKPVSATSASTFNLLESHRTHTKAFS